MCWPSMSQSMRSSQSMPSLHTRQDGRPSTVPTSGALRSPGPAPVLAAAIYESGWELGDGVSLPLWREAESAAGAGRWPAMGAVVISWRSKGWRRARWRVWRTFSRFDSTGMTV